MVIGVLDLLTGIGEVLRFFVDLSQIDFGKKKRRRRNPFQPRGQMLEFVDKLRAAFTHRADIGPILADPQKGETELEGFWTWAGEKLPKTDLADGTPQRAVHTMFGVRGGYYIEMPPARHPAEAYAVILLPPAGDQPARFLTAERIKRAAGTAVTGPGLPNKTGKVAAICEWDEDGKRTQFDQFAAPTRADITQAVRIILTGGRGAA